MPDQDFTLPSGAKFHVSVVPFQDAKALTKALMKSAAGIQLAANPMEMDVSVIKDALISAATSDDVESALFRCLERCTYNSLKVTPDLFDQPHSAEDARKDYFAMAGKVIEVNCLPFFDQTLSTLKTFLGKKNEPQKPS